MKVRLIAEHWTDAMTARFGREDATLPSWPEIPASVVVLPHDTAGAVRLLCDLAVRPGGKPAKVELFPEGRGPALVDDPKRDLVGIFIRNHPR